MHCSRSLSYQAPREIKERVLHLHCLGIAEDTVASYSAVTNFLAQLIGSGVGRKAGMLVCLELL